jgi:hypothetical protein
MEQSTEIRENLYNITKEFLNRFFEEVTDYPFSFNKFEISKIDAPISSSEFHQYDIKITTNTNIYTLNLIKK